MNEDGIEDSLQAALSESDSSTVNFYIRHALQHLHFEGDR